MSTSLAVRVEDQNKSGLVRVGQSPSPPSPPSSPGRFLAVLGRLIVAGFAVAVLTATVRIAVGFNDATPLSAVERVHIANLKTAGMFGDIVNGRLINEGDGAEIYVWVEWKGEPGCAHHTYLRTNSEFNFSFLCNRMTLSGDGELTTFVSRNPPDWVRRTATSL